MPGPFEVDRFLNIRSARGASFSPDGRFVAFLADTTGVDQLWQVPITGGWPVRLNFTEETVHLAGYSPIFHEILYGMDVGGNERTQLFLLQGIGNNDHGLGEGWGSIELTGSPTKVHHFGGWSPDGKQFAFTANREKDGRFDVYVQDRTGRGPKAARLRARGPGGYFYVLGWSRDGNTLLAQHEESSASYDLYLVDVKKGESRLLIPHEKRIRYESPEWSADGKAVWCVTTSGGRDRAGAARIEVATGKLEYVVTSPDEVEAVLPSPQGKYLAYTVNAGGRSRLFLRPLPGKVDIPAPDLPLGVVSELSFARDDSALAFTFSGPRHNADVWLWDLVDARKQPAIGRKLRQLTHASRAGIPFSELVEPRLVEYPTFDGRMIPAWYYPPARSCGAKPPYPVVVYPHGGPESQTTVSFKPYLQFFCQHGYAVFAPNVRGSTGYGTRFMDMDNVEKREGAVLDLAYAWYWLRDQGEGDPRRMAVYGWSYGGFMVLAAVTRFPSLWAAGIDVVGICNFETFLTKTSDYRKGHREAEYGSPVRDREFLRRISPLTHADRIRCPMLVIHGANDPRVPIEEAEQIVAALKEHKIPVEYVRYEDEGHGIDRLKNQRDAYPRMVRFLDRHVKHRPGG